MSQNFKAYSEEILLISTHLATTLCAICSFSSAPPGRANYNCRKYLLKSSNNQACMK